MGDQQLIVRQNSIDELLEGFNLIDTVFMCRIDRER